MTTGEHFPRDVERTGGLGRALPLNGIDHFAYLVAFCEEFKPIFKLLTRSSYRQ
jgi:hypothetical protein